MKTVQLPEMCYATLPSDESKLIVIKRGEKGYYPVNPLSDAYLCDADRNNELLGVTKAQAEAMKMGSMFGWHTPSADPNNYDENGEWKRD
ncbi:hypothetical protein PQE75_gp032 [Bacillus phage vB_BcoS-136]|uniref:Uncharacterized protein n=1 Tax=Bacillus phage vB_BcoS-136 TaxID=2419619 RepID=A0A3G3BVC3_9CAUD|nr:hypothetical protein PQE75_gp032 [Bacillus phage vB_BcoS-136]AYP68164.1 hypothetical protein vBBcoS136_00032 [Bacillus phage vB_BcoS-136]